MLSRRRPEYLNAQGMAQECKMQITMPDKRIMELAVEKSRIVDILKELEIISEEVIVAKNGRIVTEEETAGGSDELKIIRIVHGG